jgi:hypothetical protein
MQESPAEGTDEREGRSNQGSEIHGGGVGDGDEIGIVDSVQLRAAYHALTGTELLRCLLHRSAPTSCPSWWEHIQQT